MCLFWAKNNFDGLFWKKEEGDGRTLQPWQSMISGFSAACLGPVATGPFDVIKVCSWHLCRPRKLQQLFWSGAVVVHAVARCAGSLTT